MPSAALLSRLWILLVMVAVLAYASCATGAMTCAVGKPLGLGASLLAAFFLVIAPEGEREEAEEGERERARRG